MPIELRCPSCGNALQVSETEGTKPFVCPVCQESIPASAGLGSRAIHEAVPPVLTTPPEVLQYSRKDRSYGSGMAPLTRLVALVGVGGAMAVVLFVLLMAGPRSYELSHRTTCAANMSGIGKGLHTYANDGNQGMPIAAHWPEEVATATGQVNYVGRFGSKRGLEKDPAAGDTSTVDGPDGREMSTTRNLWTLIRAGGSTPASFICPDSEDAKNDEDSPQSYWDFGQGDVSVAGPLPAAQNEKAYSQVSYGYEVPYGRYGRPSGEGDQRAVLAADKGPYGVTAEMLGKSPLPGFPGKLTAKSNPKDWRSWNSPNHGGFGKGQGQNVLFADSHAEWCTTPLAGINGDNIYTQWSSPNDGAAQWIFGNGPSRSAPNLTPQSDTDSLVYP